MTIKALDAEDETEWRRLWTDYLRFYETTLPQEVFSSTFARLLSEGEFEPKGRLAVVKAKPVGLVHYLFHRSCWAEQNSCYLQDLYVDPEKRGTGLGRVLIEAVYREAEALGVTNVYWMTRETNLVGRQLYDRVGRRTGFIEYDNSKPGQ